MIHEKLDRMVLLVSSILVTLLFPIVVSAANFTDNHNDNSTSGWTVNGTRTWSESNGQALPASGNPNPGFLINNTTPSADGTLEVRMTADQWNGAKGGVVLRWTSTSSYYYVTVLPGNQWNSFIAFCENTMDPALGTKVAANFAMNTTFTLKIEMTGGTFKFFIDGTARGQITDNSLVSGKIGYGYSNDWNRYTSYDNITWTDAAPQQFTLAATANGSGTVSPSSGTYAAGTSVSVTATPAAGWHFDHWGGDATGTANPLTVVMSANRAITAYFAEDTYSLTTTTTGSGTVTPASGTYSVGTSVQITATPAAGWRFDGWSGDATGSTNPVTVVMNANRAVTARFVQITYTFAATTVGSGTVTPATGTYPSGTSVAVTATPAAGWRFDHWSGDATGAANPLTVVMSANRAIVAHFVQISYSLSVATEGSGTVSPASGTYSSGTSVEITATPAAGWHFVQWTGGATGTTNPVTVVMSANRAVVAHFEQNSFTLSVTTDGSGTVSPASGTYLPGESVEITATAAAGWHFDHWGGDASGSTNPLTVEIIGNLSIQAYFVQNATYYSLATTAIGTGTVTPSSGTYPAGQAVTVTATAGNGWHFDSWSGSITSTQNPLTVTMTSDVSLVANFVQDAYSFTASTVGQGTVTPPNGSYLSGASVSVTATAETGWRFDHWTGDATGSTNPLTIVMNNNTNVTAHFIQNTYTFAATVRGSGTVVPASGSFLHGTSVSVTATPAAGWTFHHWEGGITGSANPASITITANTSVTAVFTEIQTTVPNSEKISISSRLLSADGTPVGNELPVERDMTIKLFDQETGGNLLFTESFLDDNNQAAVVNRGYFVVRLGEGTTSGDLAAVLGANNNVWVEITVEATTFPQRIPLTSAPYVVH